MKENFNEKKQLRRVLVTETVMSLSQGWFVFQMEVLSTGQWKVKGGRVALFCTSCFEVPMQPLRGSHGFLRLLSALPGPFPCPAVAQHCLLSQGGKERRRKMMEKWSGQGRSEQSRQAELLPLEFFPSAPAFSPHCCSQPSAGILSSGPFPACLEPPELCPGSTVPPSAHPC